LDVPLTNWSAPASPITCLLGTRSFMRPILRP
jgi:hypothetical protein